MWKMAIICLIYAIAFASLIEKHPFYLLICSLLLIPLFFLTGGTLSSKKKNNDKKSLKFKDFILIFNHYYSIYSFNIKHKLTKYYPFSNLMLNDLSHFRYSPARDLDGKIWLKFKIDFTNITDDEYFFYIFYPPKSIKLKTLQDFLKTENAYASEIKYGMILVKIPKENK